MATDTHRVAPRGTTTATELHGEATWAKDTHGVELKATELLRYGLLRQGSEKIDADMIRNGFESKSRAGARKHRVLLRKGEPEQSITKQCDGADERSPATERQRSDPISKGIVKFCEAKAKYGIESQRQDRAKTRNSMELPQVAMLCSAMA